MASLVVDRPFSGDLSYHNCDTLLFERHTGQPCGLIYPTCSNYCLWPHSVIRGNLANVQVWHWYNCTTRAFQFACILGSRLHCVCNLHGLLKCTCGSIQGEAGFLNCCNNRFSWLSWLSQKQKLLPISV